MPRYEVIRPTPDTRWDRWRNAIRSFSISGKNLKDPALTKLFGSTSSATGLTVSEFSALNLSAVWAAVSLISGDVASLPLVLYRTTGRRTERYTTHPLYRLLHDAPNAHMTSITFRRTLQAHALTWGNGYAEIERDAAGRPRALWPITPDRVTPYIDGEALRYKVTNTNKPDTILDSDAMFHIPGLGFDGLAGYSVISKARESLGLGLAAERFGGTFFGNGSTFGGVLQHPGTMSDLARKNFREGIEARHKGVDRAHNFLLLEEGITYNKLGIPPNDAQFLETRQFQITEIARWFNLPPHKIGDLSHATFSNIEHQSLDYLRTTLIHWLETWEQECMRKLIAPLERNQQYVEHVVEGLLRGDSVGRAALESAEFQIGGVTPNEIRALSNRDPLVGGDRGFVQLNMIPLDRIDEWIDAQIKKASGGDTEDASPGPDASESERATWQAAIAALESAVQREQAAHDAESTRRAEAERVAQAMAEAHAAAVAAQEQAQTDLARQQLAQDEERQALVEQVEAREAALVGAQLQRDEAVAALAQLQIDAERRAAEADARLQAQTEEANLTFHRGQWLAEQVDALRAATAEATRAAELAAQRIADGETERAQLAADLAAVRAEETERRRAVIAAHRGILADALGRLVRRESANARRYSATPQKLLTWLDAFYDGAERELFVQTVTPAIRAHLAWLQADEDPVSRAEALIDAHIDESRATLRGIAEAGSEGYGELLQRTLERWDRERADRTADAVMMEALRHV